MTSATNISCVLIGASKVGELGSNVGTVVVSVPVAKKGELEPLYLPFLNLQWVQLSVLV